VVPPKAVAAGSGGVTPQEDLEGNNVEPFPLHSIILEAMVGQ
jgi:hypothetical protein